MPKKIPEGKIEVMRKMYGEFLSVAEISRKTGVSHQTAWRYTEAVERGFKSYQKYLKHLAKKKGFESHKKYREDLAEKKGFESRSEYHEHLAKKKGFESCAEYNKHLAKKRQRRPENKALRSLIKRRLKELRKNQSWLSWQMGVSKETASMYTHGESIPNKERLEKLFSALDVPYRTLEDLLEDSLKDKH